MNNIQLHTTSATCIEKMDIAEEESVEQTHEAGNQIKRQGPQQALFGSRKFVNPTSLASVTLTSAATSSSQHSTFPFRQPYSVEKNSEQVPRSKLCTNPSGTISRLWKFQQPVSTLSGQIALDNILPPKHKTFGAEATLEHVSPAKVPRKCSSTFEKTTTGAERAQTNTAVNFETSQDLPSQARFLQVSTLTLGQGSSSSPNSEASKLATSSFFTESSNNVNSPARVQQNVVSPFGQQALTDIQLNTKRVQNDISPAGIKPVSSNSFGQLSAKEISVAISSHIGYNFDSNPCVNHTSTSSVFQSFASSIENTCKAGACGELQPEAYVFGPKESEKVDSAARLNQTLTGVNNPFLARSLQMSKISIGQPSTKKPYGAIQSRAKGSLGKIRTRKNAASKTQVYSMISEPQTSQIGSGSESSFRPTTSNANLAFSLKCPIDPNIETFINNATNLTLGAKNNGQPLDAKLATTFGTGRNLFGIPTTSDTSPLYLSGSFFNSTKNKSFLPDASFTSKPVDALALCRKQGFTFMSRDGAEIANTSNSAINTDTMFGTESARSTGFDAAFGQTPHGAPGLTNGSPFSFVSATELTGFGQPFNPTLGAYTVLGQTQPNQFNQSILPCFGFIPHPTNRAEDHVVGSEFETYLIFQRESTTKNDSVTGFRTEKYTSGANVESLSGVETTTCVRFGSEFNRSLDVVTNFVRRPSFSTSLDFYDDEELASAGY